MFYPDQFPRKVSEQCLITRPRCPTTTSSGPPTRARRAGTCTTTSRACRETARTDFEDHSLTSNVIIRVEPDLGSAAEREAEDETSVFELELRAVARFRVRTSGLAHDEFADYLTECESLLETADEADALYDSFESAHEQYDEDHVVSLHLSDGELVRCVGALDDER